MNVSESRSSGWLSTATRSVLSVCVSGGVQLLAYDISYDIRARFELPASSFAGRCLQMRAHLYSGPSGGVVFYSASYFRGGNTETH